MMWEKFLRPQYVVVWRSFWRNLRKVISLRDLAKIDSNPHPAAAFLMAAIFPLHLVVFREESCPPAEFPERFAGLTLFQEGLWISNAT